MVQLSTIVYLLYLVFDSVVNYGISILFGVSTVFGLGAHPGAWRSCHVGLLRNHVLVLICQNYRLFGTFSLLKYLN